MMKLQVATDTGNLDVVFSATANSDCRLVLQRNHGLNAGGSYRQLEILITSIGL